MGQDTYSDGLYSAGSGSDGLRADHLGILLVNKLSSQHRHLAEIKATHLRARSVERTWQTCMTMGIKKKEEKMVMKYHE